MAGGRKGVVSTEQLHAAGLNDNAISRRVDAGHLHPMFTGVYAVGHRAISTRWLVPRSHARRRRRQRARAQQRDRIHIHSVKEPPDWDLSAG